jgi:peptidoglycan/xylan/chitin deacetylase (PgdA/CDA1 family)
MVRAPVLLVALVAALVLAGCGSSSGGSSTGAGGSTGSSTTKAAAKHHRRTPNAPAPLTGTYRGPVPILMYHVITAPKPGIPYAELWTPWPTFVKTMLALKKAGYGAVTMSAVWKAWHGGPGLPRKPIVLTFDDGYLSHYEHARPTLKALGWPGVLYLEGKNIDPKVGLSRHQVRSLIAAGWEIGAHTLTHPDLTTVGADQLQQEVAGSRRKIQRLFHQPVRTFAYPAGRYNAAVEAAVKAAGFDTATTTDPGIATAKDDPFALPRIRVNGTDQPDAILARIRSTSTAVPTPSAGDGE